ncbi:MAG: leucine-rich repeat protein [Ruminococcus callidus]
MFQTQNAETFREFNRHSEKLFCERFWLESVVILTASGNRTAAFQSCSLSNGLTLGSGLESIGTSAFEYSSCPVLQFPTASKRSGDSVFNENKDLTQIENFPKISGNAGRACVWSLQQSDGNSSDTGKDREIPDSLFSGCEKLDNVVLKMALHRSETVPFGMCTYENQNPRQCENSTSGAFAYNDLTDITIGKGVKNRFKSICCQSGNEHRCSGSCICHRCAGNRIRHQSETLTGI